MMVVGLVNKVMVIGKKGCVETLGKFDTGANNNSIDYIVAAKAGVGPVISSTKMRSASLKTYTRRPIIEVELKIKGKKFKTKANLTDRSNMKYKVLIGRNILFKNFIVDVSKTHEGVSDKSIKKSLLKSMGLKIGEVKFIKRP